MMHIPSGSTFTAQPEPSLIEASKSAISLMVKMLTRETELPVQIQDSKSIRDLSFEIDSLTAAIERARGEV